MTGRYGFHSRLSFPISQILQKPQSPERQYNGPEYTCDAARIVMGRRDGRSGNLQGWLRVSFCGQYGRLSVMNLARKLQFAMLVPFGEAGAIGALLALFPFAVRFPLKG